MTWSTYVATLTCGGHLLTDRPKVARRYRANTTPVTGRRRDCKSASQVLQLIAESLLLQLGLLFCLLFLLLFHLLIPTLTSGP